MSVSKVYLGSTLVAEGVAAGSSYLPSDEGTGVCKVFYQSIASAADLTLSGSFVTTLLDSSGNSQDSDTQGTAALRPILSDLMSNRTVFYQGTNGIQVSLTTIPQPFSVFLVGRYTGRDNNSASYVLRTQDSGNDLNIVYESNFNQLKMGSGGTTLIKSALAQETIIGQSVVYEFEFNGASSNIRMNNSVIATGNAGSLSLTDFNIGCNRTLGNSGWIGHMSAFWVMAGTLTTTQRNNSNTYGDSLIS